MMTEVVVNIPEQFSRFPSGRTPLDSKFSGQAFRERFLTPHLTKGQRVIVELDGAIGYGSSFLEEAFGGLVRMSALSASFLHGNLILRTYDQSLLDEIWSYIDAA